ncbi:MAG: YqjF family protein [Planctomycetota bacterium]|jgi:uncharacterized protein YqjF (DUF2071 family)
MSSVETSQMPRPHGRPVMAMTWDHLLFVHWPVAAEQLRPLIPAGLELDIFDGAAWVGLVPFTMRGVRPRWLPGRRDVPGLTRFHECNVRTYVTCGGEPAVWFFSLDAACTLPVWWARTFWSLPYERARITLEREGADVRYAVDRRGARWARQRPRLRCAWRVGAARPTSRPEELAWFLTERYQLCAFRRGRILRGRIWHPRWTLHDAELLELDDTLVGSAIATFEPEQQPLVFASEAIVVEGWPLQEGEFTTEALRTRRNTETGSGERHCQRERSLVSVNNLPSSHPTSVLSGSLW